MTSAQPNITWQSWAMVLALGFVWGGTFLFIELALRGITPFWLATARIGFAACVMTLIWSLRGFTLFATRPTRQQIATLLVVGVGTTAVPFCLLSWGLLNVTSGFAGVSMASVPLMVLPLAHFLLPGERMTLRRTIGFCIGFVGVVILIGAQAFESTGAALETPGRLACLAAAGCYAVFSIVVRRMPAIDPFGLATILLVIGAFATAPIALLVEGVPPMPDHTTLMILAFLGLVPTAAANLLRILVIRSAGPVFMSLVNYQVPIWAVVLGAWVLNEPLPSSMIWATALILSGVAISQWGALMRLFRKTS